MTDKELADLTKLHTRLQEGVFYADYDEDMRLMGVLGTYLKQFEQANKTVLVSTIHQRLADIDGKIFLSDTDTLKGVMLTLYCTDVEKIEVFKYLCRANLPKGLSPFHQCNTRDCQKFEFWTPQTETMEVVARAIADEMELEFVVDLDKDYTTAMVIEMDKFKKFDKDLHTYDDFFG